MTEKKTLYAIKCLFIKIQICIWNKNFSVLLFFIHHKYFRTGSTELTYYITKHFEALIWNISVLIEKK